MSQIRQYELIYIVASDATEQQIADLHTQVEEIAGRYSAKVDKSENWGRRKLAYEIGPHKEGDVRPRGHHRLGRAMKEIDRRLRVSDQVIRHLVVRVDEENRVIERARTLRKTEIRSAGAWRAACRRSGSLAKARSEPRTTMIASDWTTDEAM